MGARDAELLETIYQAAIDLEGLACDFATPKWEDAVQARRAAEVLHAACFELERRVLGRRARGIVSALGRKRDAGGRFVSREAARAVTEDERDEWVDRWIMAAGRQ